MENNCKMLKLLLTIYCFTVLLLKFCEGFQHTPRGPSVFAVCAEALDTNLKSQLVVWTRELWIVVSPQRSNGTTISTQASESALSELFEGAPFVR